MYPIVPGHELVGVVSEVGSNVTRVKVGSLVAVGCTIDSCMECDMCDAGEENYCRKGELTITITSIMVLVLHQCFLENKADYVNAI